VVAPEQKGMPSLFFLNFNRAAIGVWQSQN
jgi:hypothetical protein